jgi:hypothetical protein
MHVTMAVLAPTCTASLQPRGTAATAACLVVEQEPGLQGGCCSQPLLIQGGGQALIVLLNLWGTRGSDGCAMKNRCDLGDVRLRELLGCSVVFKGIVLWAQWLRSCLEMG